MALALTNRRGFPADFGRDEVAITAYFGFELALASVNFATILTVHGQELFGDWLTETGDEGIQMATFLLQVLGDSR